MTTYYVIFRLRPINGLEGLVVWQLVNVFDCLQHGLFITKWKRVLFPRYYNDIMPPC